MHVSDLPELLLALAAVLTALGAGRAISKLLSRNTDEAHIAKLRADAAATEVTTLREVLEEMRLSAQSKTERIENLEDRLLRLEERERRQVIRTLNHEIWDRMAVEALRSIDPTFASPPPIFEPDNLAS